MITNDKMIEIFCIADDFYNEYEIQIEKLLLEAPINESLIKKRNRKGKLSPSEIIAILICYRWVDQGISALASRGTVRETLASHGSSYSILHNFCFAYGHAPHSQW